MSTRNDTPTTGDIASISVLASLAVSRLHPEVSDVRIASLASGLAIAIVAMLPDTELTQQLLRQRMNETLARDSSGNEAGWLTLAERIVDETGIATVNALTLAKAAIYKASLVGLASPAKVESYECRDDGKGGYAIVLDDVMLAEIELSPR